MKTILSLLFVVFLSMHVKSQQDTAAPFRRFPTVPPFKLLKTDSTGYFTKDDLKKNKPVLIILFSPDCDHCQHETEEIIKRMDDFKNIQIVMSTNMPFSMMKDFYNKYELNKYDNIMVGLDYQYILPPFFRPRNLPFLAMYNKKGNLLTTFEGSMKMDDLLKVYK